jgi:predicted DNA-binding WGR domain protein
MSGYSTYTRWRRIEEHALTLGFRLANPKHGHWGGGSDDGTDRVALYPAGEALPVYTRDAEIYTGTFGQVETFLNGWARAQQYDMMLRLTDDKKRKKYEDNERARQAEQKKREEQKKMIEVLKSTDQQNRVAKK